MEKDGHFNEWCWNNWTSTSKKEGVGDFLGSPVVKNRPFKAEDEGWTPGCAIKIPNAKGKLSLCATTVPTCFS